MLPQDTLRDLTLPSEVDRRLIHYVIHVTLRAPPMTHCQKLMRTESANSLVS
uniref:Uncharacterized protein n=1 Tax=Anguilla anguilla TaxID=7936 RepID=A0A0E9TBL2_ANGAN